jgi:hypothetical protein
LAVTECSSGRGDGITKFLCVDHLVVRLRHFLRGDLHLLLLLLLQWRVGGVSLESRSLFIVVEDSASSANLCLPLLSLDAIFWRRERLERERVIGWTYERAIGRSGIYSHHRLHIRGDASVMGCDASNSQ